MTEKPNRVWIELDYPSIKDFPDTKDAVAEERAAKLDKLLRKLGYMPDYKGKLVFWFPKKERFCFTQDYGGSYVEAGDNGHWFNLDYLSKE